MTVLERAKEKSSKTHRLVFVYFDPTTLQWSIRIRPHPWLNQLATFLAGERIS